MNLYELAAEVVAGLEAEGSSYMVVGALSVKNHGFPGSFGLPKHGKKEFRPWLVHRRGAVTDLLSVRSVKSVVPSL